MSTSLTSSERSADDNHHIEHHVVAELSDDFDDIDLEDDIPDEAESGPPERSGPVDQEKSRLALLVDLIERMEPTRPEILRAAPVHQVVAWFGRVFWARKSRDFFHLSRVTESYDEFLSHSWQVAAWQKVLLLMILKNGLPAYIFGTVGALLMMVLWQFNFLPGFAKLGTTWSCWCSSAGLFMALLTLTAWRARGSIFVDRLCINQFDPRMKSEGILNIGAILKRSHSLLVLFDETYAERLWCLFEIAAFLKAHPEAVAGKSALVQVIPMQLGVISSAASVGALGAGIFAVFNPFENVFVIWSVFMAYLAAEGMFLVRSFRHYYRSLEVIQHQVQHFQLQNAVCWCCSVNHIHPISGQPIAVCDREIVRQCVTSWFGSEKEFDESVRSVVARALQEQLGYDAFPYSWMLGCFLPVWWPFIDFVAVYQATEEIRFLVPYFVIRFFAFWLWVIPMIGTGGLFFARCLRRESRWKCLDPFRDLLVLLLVAPLLLAAVAWFLYTELTFFERDETLGSVIFAAGCFVAFLVVRKAYHFGNRRLFTSLGA